MHTFKSAKLWLPAALLILSTAWTLAGDTYLVRVKSTSVNLRPKASLESEIVGQAQKGDFLVGRRIEDLDTEWVEILPPEGMKFWVHREFLDGNKVGANKLNVRAGSGINYTIVGRLEQGDTVEIIDEFGEWLAIEPPISCSVYISRGLVEYYEEKEDVVTPELLPPEPLYTTPQDQQRSRVQMEATYPGEDIVKPIRKPVAGPGTLGKPPVKPSVVAAQDARPSTQKITAKRPYGLSLIPLEGQGQLVQKEGILKKVGFVFGKPAKFKLVSRQPGKDTLICYVHGNTQQLIAFLGQDLKIKGPQYWVKGVRDPVVVPQQIAPIGY